MLCFKLKQYTGRDAFSQDEIYTAIQAVGQRTPASLSATFNNMTSRHGLGTQEDGKFKPNFKCDDLVNHDLPKQKASND